ncbi:hypothetical protein HYW83_03565, partial [Candidatus Peregrinibacteria bacterium]|nr:hypothetical protein [Candidatus Peregrinibacteria bacterium]
MPQIMQPEVTFFVESREESEIVKKNDRKIRSRGQFLLDRLGGGDIVDALRAVRGRLSIAMSRRDLSNDDALVDFLLEMNALEIGVDIWPTLPDEDGYWIHADNSQKARANVFGIIEALERRRVDFKNVGLDLEFPIGLKLGGPIAETLRQLMKIRPWQFSQTGAAKNIENS